MQDYLLDDRNIITNCDSDFSNSDASCYCNCHNSYTDVTFMNGVDKFQSGEVVICEGEMGCDSVSLDIHVPVEPEQPVAKLPYWYGKEIQWVVSGFKVGSVCKKPAEGGLDVCQEYNKPKKLSRCKTPLIKSEYESYGPVIKQWPFLIDSYETYEKINKSSYKFGGMTAGTKGWSYSCYYSYEVVD